MIEFTEAWLTFSMLTIAVLRLKTEIIEIEFTKKEIVFQVKWLCRFESGERGVTGTTWRFDYGASKDGVHGNLLKYSRATR